MKAKRSAHDFSDAKSLYPITKMRQNFMEQGEAKLTPLEPSEVSRQLKSLFVPEDESGLKITDEIPTKVIAYVVVECRMLISARRMTSEGWNALTRFLEGELLAFRDLKKECAAVERKIHLVRQRMQEAMSPALRPVSMNRVMACAMLLAETEMRQENLAERVAMVSRELTRLILANVTVGPERQELEARLASVFATLYDGQRARS